MNKFYNLHDSLIIENSFYKSGDNTSREKFTDDDITVKNCFWITVLGFFGLMTLPNHAPKFKGVKTREYFKNDLKVRLAHITDDNNDLSLIIKIVTDKGWLKPTTVTKLTRLLAKLKTGSIASLDDSHILELLNEIIYTKLKPDLKLGKFVKPYLAGDISLASILEPLYTYAVRTKSCNEFKRIARPARATFKRLMVDGDTLDGSDAPMVDTTAQETAPVVVTPPSAGIMNTKIREITTQLKVESTHTNACVNIMKYAITGGNLSKLPQIGEKALSNFEDYMDINEVIEEIYSVFNSNNIVKYLPIGTQVSNIPEWVLHRYIGALFTKYIKLNGTSIDFFSKKNEDILMEYNKCIPNKYNDPWANQLHVALWNKELTMSNLLASIRKNSNRIQWESDFADYMYTHSLRYGEQMNQVAGFTDADYDNILWFIGTFNAIKSNIVKQNRFLKSLILGITNKIWDNKSLNRLLGTNQSRANFEYILTNSDINFIITILNPNNENSIITLMRILDANTIDELIKNCTWGTAKFILSLRNNFHHETTPEMVLQLIEKAHPNKLSNWLINYGFNIWYTIDPRFGILAFDNLNIELISKRSRFEQEQLFTHKKVFTYIPKSIYLKKLYELVKAQSPNTMGLLSERIGNYLLANTNEKYTKDIINLFISLELGSLTNGSHNVIGLAMRSNNKHRILDTILQKNNNTDTRPPKFLKVLQDNTIPWLSDAEIVDFLDININLNGLLGALIRISISKFSDFNMPDGVTKLNIYNRLLTLAPMEDITARVIEMDRLDIFTTTFNDIKTTDIELISKLSTVDWGNTVVKPYVYRNANCDLEAIKAVNEDMYQRTMVDYTDTTCGLLIEGGGGYSDAFNANQVKRIISVMNDDTNLLTIGDVINNFIDRKYRDSRRKKSYTSKLRNAFAREIEKLGIIQATLDITSNGNSLITPNTTLSAKDIITAFKFNDIDVGTTSVRLRKNETIGEMLIRAKHLMSSNTTIPEQQIEKEDRTVDELIDTTIKYNRMRTGRHGTNALEFIEEYTVKWENVSRFHLDTYNKLIETEGEDTVLKPMFHATDAMAASFILRSGFVVDDSNVKAGRMLGNGIYFSNAIDKITAYVSEQAYRNTSGETTGYVLELEAIPGKKDTDYQSAGFGADGIRSPEWCIFDYENRIKVVKAYKVKVVSIDEVHKKEKQRLGESNTDYDSRLLRKFLEEKNK